MIWHRVISIAALFCATTEAWWDGGHMLVAAVAQEHLKMQNKIDVIDKVNLILQHGERDFPGQSTLISSATWADKIKCTGDSVSCKKLPRYDNFKLFNTLHYSDVIYNVSDNDATPLPDDAIISTALKVEGAATTLRTISDMLLYNTTSKQYGTAFTYNIYFRLMIHIIGDIHQPLHTCALDSYYTPGGDQGGNLVLVEFPGPCDIKNLHSLWDSVLGTQCVSMPDLTENDAIRKATEIMGNYTAKSFGERINTPWNATLPESYALCIDTVYPEMLGEACTASKTSTPAPTSPREPAVQPLKCDGDWVSNTTKYSPSKEYVDSRLLVAHKQIALAGYRLAGYLEKSVSRVPNDVYAFIKTASPAPAFATFSVLAIGLLLFV